ncbi:MAG: hypothetical protein EOR97_17470 [Mesorhizobium sp.]|uniref:hypothetical protein n=1 Tax=Mesorhizobium sp. TaxID=1871066 RepID=UPI000FE6A4C3|nr:hypothetical protein [Mesorhizobium sp.]RWN30161.1 MAG: hypothetical protein EOR97_17470 [Mesorhizobium sp.]
MDKKVIGLVVLALVGLGAYQAATGGIKPSVDLVEAKAACADAIDRARALRAGAPLPQSETIDHYELVLTDCRNKQYVSGTELGDLLD